MANRRLEEIKPLCMASDNRDAFSRLVEIHQQGLRRFLLNLTGGDEALTDDLAQETFLKAWLAVRSFHGLSGFKTWLYRIARMDVATMLQMLPEKEKMVVLLFYLEELPVKEISKITGMPEGTVKSHLSRARVHLSKIR